MTRFHHSDDLVGDDLPYSALVDTGQTVYVSGVLAQDSGAWHGGSGTIEDETAASLELIERMLQSVDLSLLDVVSVLIHMTDLTEFDRMNAVYVDYFDTQKRPARTCVGVSALLEGAKIEITVTAERSQI